MLDILMPNAVDAGETTIRRDVSNLERDTKLSARSLACDYLGKVPCSCTQLHPWRRSPTNRATAQPSLCSRQALGYTTDKVDQF